MKSLGRNGGEISLNLIEFEKELTKTWQRDGSYILDRIQELSGIEWKEKEIPVYIVYTLPYGGISHPLCITPHQNYLVTLTHELIHRNLAEARIDMTELMMRLNISRKVAVHIPVCFIEKQILSEIGIKEPSEPAKAFQYILKRYEPHWKKYISKRRPNILQFLQSLPKSEDFELIP